MKNAINNTGNGVTDTDSVPSSKNGVKNDETIKTNSQKLPTAVSTSKDRSSAKLHFLKQSFRTLSVPKKIVEKHLDKDKNEPSRFLGEGVTFKAKLIGILEVEEARGDRMCQEALYELKMAVRAAGEHKQRINIVISIDGIRLRDEKTGDCLHHHPVHKISFIAQDVADSRAFGYIYGSPDTTHRFFGIKTDKAANQVVMTMRDLFQAVFDLKKREVEIAKQNIEQHQLRYGSSMYLDTIPASSKVCATNTALQTASTTSDSTSALNVKLKTSFKDETTANRSAKNKTQTAGVIADLMDLELELNSLQQGLSQMERLTPSDPFGPSPSLTKEDPFGDSFTPPPPRITTPPPAKLPPPPITGDRRKTGGSTSSTHSQPELHWFDKETRDLFSSEKNLTEGNDKEKKDGQRLTTEGDAKDLYDIFTELDPLGTGRSKPYTDKKDFFQELKNPPKKLLNDLRSVEGGSVSDKNVTSAASFPNSSRSLYAPHEDTEKLYDEHVRKYNSIDSERRITLAEDLIKPESYYESSNATTTAPSNDPFETSFANFASFDRNGGGGVEIESRRSPHIHRTSPANLHTIGGDVLQSSVTSSFARSTYRDELDAQSSVTSQSDSQKNRWSQGELAASRQKIVINLRRVLSNADDTDKENDSPVTEDGATVLKNLDATSPPARGGNASSDSFESIPEPPPRPITSPMASQPPPPLPPKKLQLPITLKPPPRTSTANSSSHYDYIENYESVSMLSSRHKLNGDVQIPPLPAPARKPKISSFHDNQVRKRPTKQSCSSDSDYYLTPIGKSKEESTKIRKAKPSSSLNITISQLTSTGFDDLAAMLRIPASELSKMTLKELTECLSKLSIAECQKLESDMSKRTAATATVDERKTHRSLKKPFDDSSTTTFRANFEEKFPIKSASEQVPQIDKYAVFRELIEQEKRETEQNQVENVDEPTNDETVTPTTKEMDENDSESDKYAALRIIDPANKEAESSTKETKEEEEKMIELESKDDEVGTTSDLKSEQAKVEITVTKDGTVAPGEQDVGQNWAKFDSEMETTTLKEHKRQLHSPWQDNTKDVEEDEEEEEVIKPIRYRKQTTRRWNEDDEDEEEEDDDYGDDSEENWESSKRSLGSSWDESSWRENGWSDRDSLYDDAETSPAASYREHKYDGRRKGYQKRFSPPPSSKKSAEHLPWDEETIASTHTVPEWQSSRKGYKEYYLRDDERKMRIAPWSGVGGVANERRRYETKEQDELMLLKMMLGKKRLKALEEQLFKHYHEQQQQPQKSAHHRYAKSSSKESAADKEYAAAKSWYQRKHHAQRPKSVDKRSRSGALHSLTHVRHPDDTEELFSAKKYVTPRGPPSRPYSHDELSISEEERWAHRSPANYKKPSSSSGRSRNHSQTSPFEDDFTTVASPQPYELADSLSETASSGHCTKAVGKSSSRYSSGKKTPDSKRSLELHPYSTYDYKSSRNGKESSQRQSPFEDNFAPPLQPSSIEQKAGDTIDDAEDGLYGGGESMGRSSRTGRVSRSSRHEHRAKPSKYYENVELRKRMPDSYYEKLSKEKYKYATVAPAVKESMDAALIEGRSPKKNKISGMDARKHDPFNDDRSAAMQTMPRLQNTNSKSKLQSNYDSESDSPLEGTDGPSTTLPSSSSKWKDDLSTFGFAETQQHTRK